MVGVCFGHQLIAQALGGTARKSEKGWGLGRHVYDVAAGNGLIDGRHIALACSHQDQVITPPAGATTILSSDFTPMPGCSTPAAPRSRCRHTRNSLSALRWRAARWCAARATRPIASWHRRKPRLRSRWRVPGWAVRSRAFSPARPRRRRGPEGRIQNSQNNPMQSRRRGQKRYLVTPPSPPASRARRAAAPPSGTARRRPSARSQRRLHGGAVLHWHQDRLHRQLLLVANERSCKARRSTGKSVEASPPRHPSSVRCLIQAG